MRCEIVQLELNAFIDDQLPWAMLLDVERHLATCAACQAHAERLRRLEDLLADLPAVPVPGGFTARILGAARRQLRAPEHANELGLSKPRRVKLIPVIDAVATAILLLGLSLGTWMARHTWRRAEKTGTSSAVATRTAYDIGGFYGAVSENVEIHRPLPQVYLTFVDRTALGE